MSVCSFLVKSKMKNNDNDDKYNGIMNKNEGEK